MPSIAAVYCTYDDAEWLTPSLQSIYCAVDAIYVLVSSRPWNGPYFSPDETLNCIAAFSDPEKKIRLVRGEWASEVEQRNAGLEMLARGEFDYCFIIDSDEIYDTDALGRMFQLAKSRPDVGCWHCWFIVYWKSSQYRIDPPELHHPPILLKIGAGAFAEYRNCLANSHELIPPEIGYCHHMSYARTDEQIQKKIRSFSHSHQIDPQWFEKKWKGWDADKTVTDLCPYNPGVFQRTAEVPAEALPKVLRDKQQG